jgi:hypothetical protein
MVIAIGQSSTDPNKAHQAEAGKALLTHCKAGQPNDLCSERLWVLMPLPRQVLESKTRTHFLDWPAVRNSANKGHNAAKGIAYSEVAE